MNKLQDISNLLTGTSLCIVASIFILEGSLSLLGIIIFVPMALGGLGMLLNSIRQIYSWEIFDELPLKMAA